MPGEGVAAPELCLHHCIHDAQVGDALLATGPDALPSVQLRQHLRGLRGQTLPLLRRLPGARPHLHRGQEAGPARQGIVKYIINRDL